MSMTATAKPLGIIARCAECSTKTQLFVCPHCDNVICQVCVNKHRSELNATLKEHWSTCKTKYLNFCHLSSKRCSIDMCQIWNWGWSQHRQLWQRSDCRRTRNRSNANDDRATLLRFCSFDRKWEEYTADQHRRLHQICFIQVRAKLNDQSFSFTIRSSVKSSDLQQVFDSINQRLEDMIQ